MKNWNEDMDKLYRNLKEKYPDEAKTLYNQFLNDYGKKHEADDISQEEYYGNQSREFIQYLNLRNYDLFRGEKPNEED